MANKTVLSVIFAAGAAVGGGGQQVSGMVDYDELQPRQILEGEAVTQATTLVLAMGWAEEDGAPSMFGCRREGDALACYADNRLKALDGHAATAAELAALAPLAAQFETDDIARLREFECSTRGDQTSCYAIVRKTGTPAQVASLIDSNNLKGLHQSE